MKLRRLLKFSSPELEDQYLNYLARRSLPVARTFFLLESAYICVYLANFWAKAWAHHAENSGAAVCPAKSRSIAWCMFQDIGTALMFAGLAVCLVSSTAWCLLMYIAPGIYNHQRSLLLMLSRLLPAVIGSAFIQVATCRFDVPGKKCKEVLLHKLYVIIRPIVTKTPLAWAVPYCLTSLLLYSVLHATIAPVPIGSSPWVGHVVLLLEELVFPGWILYIQERRDRLRFLEQLESSRQGIQQIEEGAEPADDHAPSSRTRQASTTSGEVPLAAMAPEQAANTRPSNAGGSSLAPAPMMLEEDSTQHGQPCLAEPVTIQDGIRNQEAGIPLGSIPSPTSSSPSAQIQLHQVAPAGGPSTQHAARGYRSVFRHRLVTLKVKPPTSEHAGPELKQAVGRAVHRSLVGQMARPMPPAPFITNTTSFPGCDWYLFQVTLPTALDTRERGPVQISEAILKELESVLPAGSEVLTVSVGRWRPGPAMAEALTHLLPLSQAQKHATLVPTIQCQGDTTDKHSFFYLTPLALPFHEDTGALAAGGSSSSTEENRGTPEIRGVENSSIMGERCSCADHRSVAECSSVAASSSARKCSNMEESSRFAGDNTGNTDTGSAADNSSFTEDGTITDGSCATGIRLDAKYDRCIILGQPYATDIAGATGYSNATTLCLMTESNASAGSSKDNLQSHDCIRATLHCPMIQLQRLLHLGLKQLRVVVVENHGRMKVQAGDKDNVVFDQRWKLDKLVEQAGGRDDPKLHLFLPSGKVSRHVQPARWFNVVVAVSGQEGQEGTGWNRHGQSMVAERDSGYGQEKQGMGWGLASGGEERANGDEIVQGHHVAARPGQLTDWDSGTGKEQYDMGQEHAGDGKEGANLPQVVQDQHREGVWTPGTGKEQNGREQEHASGGKEEAISYQFVQEKYVRQGPSSNKNSKQGAQPEEGGSTHESARHPTTFQATTSATCLLNAPEVIVSCSPLPVLPRPVCVELQGLLEHMMKQVHDTMNHSGAYQNMMHVVTDFLVVLTSISFTPADKMDDDDALALAKTQKCGRHTTSEQWEDTLHGAVKSLSTYFRMQCMDASLSLLSKVVPGEVFVELEASGPIAPVSLVPAASAASAAETTPALAAAAVASIAAVTVADASTTAVLL